MSLGISSHVRASVLAALYAGKTTTIRFPLSIPPPFGKQGLPIQISLPAMD
jgi:hypothetical protein